MRWIARPPVFPLQRGVPLGAAREHARIRSELCRKLIFLQFDFALRRPSAEGRATSSARPKPEVPVPSFRRPSRSGPARRVSFLPRAEPLESRTLLTLQPIGDTFAVHAGPPLADRAPMTAMD